MTPIRNVTDRERDLTAERDEYKAHAQLLQTLLMKRTAERDALKADALRYRWLRDMADAATWEMLGYQDPGQVDRAADELMKEGAA